MLKKLVSLNLAILLLLAMLPISAGAASGSSGDSILTRAVMCQKIVEVIDPPDLADYGQMESPFSDVTKDMEQYNAIMYCYEEGFVNGTGSGRFLPSNNLTRAEVATMLFRIAESPQGYFPETEPADVALDKWYYESCCAVIAMKMMAVDGNNNFRPNATAYSSEINWELLADFLPQPMTYQGSNHIIIPFEQVLEIPYADFCDSQGISLGLNDSCNFSLDMKSGDWLGYGRGPEYFELGINSPSVGSIGTLTAEKDGKRYQLEVSIGFPEFGVYHTAPELNTEYLFGNAHFDFAVNYKLDKKIYIMPSNSQYTFTEAAASGDCAENLTVALGGSGKYIEISVKPGMTGSFEGQITATWQVNGGEAETRDFWFNLTDEAKLYSNGSVGYGAFPGTETLLPLSVRPNGNPIKKEDGFTFRLEGFPGKLWWHSRGNLYLSIYNNAKIGSYGQVIATKDGVSYTFDIDIVRPYLGFYSDPQGTDESCLGSYGFVDTSKSSFPRTVYLICPYGLTGVGFHEENPPFTTEIVEDEINGAYIKFTLKPGLTSGSARFTASVADSSGRPEGMLTFAEPTALRTEDGALQVTMEGGRGRGISLYRADTGEQIDRTYSLGVEGRIGNVEWMDSESQLVYLYTYDAVPGATGRITATKNGVTYYIPVQIGLSEIGIYRAPQATAENALGETVNFVEDPSLKTVYIVPSAESGITSFSNVVVEEWCRNDVSVSLASGGKYIKVTLKNTSKHEVNALFSYKARYADGSQGERYQWVTFTDGTVLRLESGTDYYSEKNLLKFKTWDGIPIDDSYTVTLKKNGVSADWKWVDSDTLLWDATKLGPNDADGWQLTAKKGTESYLYDFYLGRPDFSAFSRPICDDRYFLHGPSGATDYSKGQRTVYIYSYVTSMGDMCLFTEAQSDNDQIEVSLVDNMQALEVTLNSNATGTVSGNICYKTDDMSSNAFGTLHVSFTADSTAPATEGAMDTGVTWEVDQNGTLNLTGDGVVDDYASDVEWSDVKDQVTEVSIGEGVTSIGSGAFQDFTNLTAVTVPESVTQIDKNAFAGCASLETVKIPSTVESIDTTAFENCDGVTIQGDAGDTYAETFAMVKDIAYESEPELAETTGTLNLDVGKVVSVSGRVAVAAVVENGTEQIENGNIVTGIYYQGRLVSCAVLDNKTVLQEQKSRAVLQIPYTIKDIDPEQIDIRVMYLGTDNVAPLADSAKSDTANAYTGV